MKMSLQDAREVLRVAGVELSSRWGSASKLEKGIAVFLTGMGVIIPIFGRGIAKWPIAALYMAAGSFVAFSKPATYSQVVVLSSGEQAALTANLVVQALDAYLKANARR